MEKRYQVFVSSTFQDLREERQAVIQVLLEANCIPSGMEMFPASDETAKQLIERVIKECDYYVVIVGGRYGSIDSDGISYTEWEYDTAVRLEIPVLGFVHADPSQIPAGKSEMNKPAQEQLEAFRKKVLQRHCKSYKNVDDLGGKVSRAINQAISLNPRDGWVPGRFASSPERINELRTQVDDLQKQLDEARVKPPVEAEGLAHGDDQFEMRFLNRLEDVYHIVPMEWDHIIATVGPLMFNEATEGALEGELIRWVSAIQAWTHRHIELVSADFQTIKTQLLALGMIKQSEKKRAPSDTATYWTLTPYGRHYTVQLKAVRRPRAPLTIGGG